MSTIQYLSSSESGDRASAIYTDAMARMYGLVALGIVTTGAAIWFGDSLGIGDAIFSFGWIGYIAAFAIIMGTLLPLFLALTVWETKKMKELAQEAAMAGDAQSATQVAVTDSIGLYLNALNIFLILLNLLGFASDD